jgi:CDP-diacylglycerol--glycerol-3-phosphate 3-phosphatidyltransferase
MNIANAITVFRIILTVIFVFFVFQSQNIFISLKARLVFQYLTLICFLLAAFSDFIDGKLARSRGTVTDFGKFMDPLADKILILAAFLSFLALDDNVLYIPLWAVVVIISREFSITGLRFLAVANSKILIPSRWNKHKTFSQMFSIFSILSYLVLKYTREFFKCQNVWLNKVIAYLPDFIYFFICFAVFLTLASGIFYLKAHRSIIFGSKKD